MRKRRLTIAGVGLARGCRGRARPRAGGRQVDLELGLHLDDARGDLAQAQAEGVELGS